jgi:hypothetical protein
MFPMFTVTSLLSDISPAPGSFENGEASNVEERRRRIAVCPAWQAKSYFGSG